MGTIPISASSAERDAFQRYSVHAMVNSVGPYKFSRMLLGAASNHALAEEIGRGSPQNKLHRNRGYCPGFSIPSCFMNTATDGTENHTVNSASWMNLPGLISVFCEGQQTHAPRSQATNISNTDKSKVMSNICDSRSSSVIA